MDGVPLARQDVSLVFAVEGEARGAHKQPVERRLRMLAVFSLPSEGTALALRRERYALTRLVRRIASRYGRAIELEVLQYGVTRQRLAASLRDGRGWDLVHFSGHGMADGLALERSDGTTDLVPTPDLLRLLHPARARLKLVTLSSCLSAAATAAETRRWLALAVPGGSEAEARSATAPALPGLARELVRKLDCAVLAMRYSVEDDFAIALDEGLYEGLLGQDQPLPRALQLALPEAAGNEPSWSAPAISLGTPALFGPLAAELALIPPKGQPNFNVGTAKVAYFPDEPERFVGRAGVMARASIVLAPKNQQQHNRVLLHGMAGAGKTACALELAYRHEQAFGALVWWQAPEQRRDITTSLRDLAVALETQLEGFAMVHAAGGEAELQRFLPRLTQLLEEHAVLLVLDNLESLLTEQGRWRNPHWGLLIDALVRHRGESRLVLTSRVRPEGLDGRVLVEPVHALSLDEALLLARELPNLGRLLRQDTTLGQGGQEHVAAGAALVRRVLEIVQGDPKLLELADAEAGDPAALRDRLAEADRALPGQAGRLAAFFAQGESALAPEQFLRVLAGWTHGAAAALPEDARVLLWVLCALEEADRWRFVLQRVWPLLWRRLDRSEEPQVLDEALAPLVTRALIHLDHQGEDQTHYRVHPGVAEAARQDAGEAFQAAVDTELGAFWQAAFQQAHRAAGGEAGWWVLRAGRSAVPYLLRLGDWATASELLDEVLYRDQSPATVQMVLPLLRQVATATTGTDRELVDAGRLARALGFVQPEAAETQLRDLLDRAVHQERFDLAVAASGELANLLRGAGRLEEALAVVEQLPEFTRLAGLGPWTQLLNQGHRLTLLAHMGRAEEVLAQVQELRGELAVLPDSGDQEERTEPWNVRELILHAGYAAALWLGRWEQALALNAEVVEITVARGATDLEIAHTRFNGYGPLLRLDRLDEAERLLLACRAVFEDEGDLASLGKVLGALADLEDKRGHPDDAIGFAQAALRYGYATGDPDVAAASHHNLATSLERTGKDPAAELAHRLAAALISYRMGSGGLVGRLRALADNLARVGEAASLPASFAELCAVVGQVGGVRLAELVARLPRRAAEGDQALAEVLRLARALPDHASGDAQELLEQ